MSRRYARVTVSNAFDRWQHGMHASNCRRRGHIALYVDASELVSKPRSRMVNAEDRVCLSARKYISETRCPNFIMHIACGHGSVLFWLRCNMLYRPTSGFVDDVIFSYHWPFGSVALPQQLCFNVMHGLTPCCVLY